jgi:hypothetical protein
MTRVKRIEIAMPEKGKQAREPGRLRWVLLAAAGAFIARQLFSELPSLRRYWNITRM